MKQGFTLIELMVVVLIIGILSAAALPQYRQSVERSRTAEAVLTSKSILDAASLYYTTYRSCPTSLSDLDVKVLAETEDWHFGANQLGNGLCAATVADSEETFQAYRVLVKNSAESDGIPVGTMYWSCQGGDCDEFFSLAGIKLQDNGLYQ